MRRARELAHRELPCVVCGSRREPVLRRPRHLSSAWRFNPDAYLACAGCGRRLQAITGAAAMRESEIAADRIPDPLGALTGFDLPGDVERHAWTTGAMPDGDWLATRVREGVGNASPAISSRVEESLVNFAHLGSSWIRVAVRAGSAGSSRSVEAGYLVALAPAHEFQPEPMRLVRAIEISAGSDPWQVRYYEATRAESSGG